MLMLALTLPPMLQLLRIHVQLVIFAQEPVPALHRIAELETIAHRQVWQRRRSARKAAIAPVSMPNAGILAEINTAQQVARMLEALAHLAKRAQQPLELTSAPVAVY